MCQWWQVATPPRWQIRGTKVLGMRVAHGTLKKTEPGMVADFAVTGRAMPAVVAAKVLWVAQFKIARVPESALYAGNQRADARSLVVNRLFR